MDEIRFIGRGGQGVVTAAELLSVAAFLDGRFALAFPSFGSERTGAPIAAFCRIDSVAIRLREPIVHPDVVVVLDPTLLHAADTLSGLAAGGFVLVNSSRSPVELGLTELLGRLGVGHVRTVAATELARRIVGQPLPNAALLGAFAAMTGLVTLGSVSTALRQRFGGVVGERNLAAAEAAAAQLGPRGEAARC